MPNDPVNDDAGSQDGQDDQGAGDEKNDQGGAGDEFDRDRAMALITKLRDETKTLKGEAKKAADLEKRLKELEDAQKTEEEKRAERLAALEAEKAAWEADRQEYRLRLAVHASAVELGIADADLALAALNRSGIEYDQSGEPTNLPDVLKELLERKPILRAKTEGAGGDDQGSGDIGAGAGQKTPPAPKLTAEQLEVAKSLGMTPERYAAYLNVRSINDYAAFREREKAGAK